MNLSNRTHAFDQWLNHNIQLDWVKAEVVKDAPDKIHAKAKKEQHLNFQMVKRLDIPTQNVDLISAYFVPQKKAQRNWLSWQMRALKYVS